MSNLGLPSGKVLLRPYCAEWAEVYHREESRIRAAIGHSIEDIRHVGSTSVPGIAAKPIIDIAIAVKSLPEAVECVEPLTELGYHFKGEHGIPNRWYFTRGEPCSFHIHITETGSQNWLSLVLFCEFLRAHPGFAAEYESLKLDLAARFPSDREAYTNGKNTFIRDLLLRAQKNAQ